MSRQENTSGQDTERHIFEIRGCYCGDKTFPSLNQYLQEIGKNPRAGGKLKKDYMMIACNAIRRDLRGFKTKKPIILHYKFFEPLKGQLRDLGNIFSMADKVIEDALQECKVIENDDPHHVKGFTHEFYYTSRTPFIRVEIEEVETPMVKP